MDPTSSVSRDPRLNRPSLPNTRWNEHGESPQRPTAGPRQYSAPTLQNDASRDVFISGMNELMRMVYFENTNLSKREEIQERRSETEGMLRRAKTQPAFPAVFDSIQHTRTELDRALAEIDDKIKNQDSQRQRLVSDLGNIWAAVANSKSSEVEEKVLQLQEDVKSANDKISSLHGEIASLINYNKAVDSQLNGLVKKLDAQQDMITAQQKSFGSYTNSWAIIKKDVDVLKKDLDPLRKGLDEYATRVKHLEERPVQTGNGITADTKKALDDLSVQFKSLEQRTAAFTEEIEALSSSYQRISGVPGQVNGQLNQQQQRLAEQQQKIDQLNANRATNPNLTKVEGDILSINNRFEKMREILSTKDDFQFAQMEDLGKKLNQVKQDHDNLAETMKEALLRTPKEPLDTKVNGLLTEVRDFHEQIGQIEVVSMAIQSLETRYNNVSTESLAQHMLGAMRELYPTPDKIIGDLTGHRQELISLRQKIEQLDGRPDASLVVQNDLKVIRAAYENLRFAVSEVKQRYQGIDPQQILHMQTRIDALSDKQNTTHGALQQKQTEDEGLLQKIKDEGESINSRLTSLQGDLEKLNSDFNQAKPNAANDEESLRSLETRISALEESTTQGYDKLKTQMDRLKKTMRHQEAPSERASSQPDSAPRIQPPPIPDLLDGSLGMPIKRRYPSDDERSPVPSSPHSPNAVSAALAQGESRKKKKKKKRRLEAQALTQSQALSQTPIEIDD
ncbi:hypothetical protein BDV06DRAFT_126300 [Aspergillus oleicola]